MFSEEACRLNILIVIMMIVMMVMVFIMFMVIMMVLKSFTFKESCYLKRLALQVDHRES